MYRDIADWLRTSTAGEAAITSSLVAFPTECLPRVVRETVKTCAVAHQVPQALAGCVALGVLSAAVGKGLVVRSASTRVTGANLFIVVGAGSGAGKSETFADLASPLVEFESQQNLDWCTDQIRRKAEGHVLEVKIRSLDRRLVSARSDVEHSRNQNMIQHALDA